MRGKAISPFSQTIWYDDELSRAFLDVFMRVGELTCPAFLHNNNPTILTPIKGIIWATHHQPSLGALFTCL
jgi:hypothetical protein